jgi:hypothetical protein
MCDTFVIVGEANVIFGKNSDRDPNEAQVLSWIDSAEHAPGAELHCTWRSIPQARRTHAALISRPFWMWGAEMGVNEHGVAIGNEAVFTRAPLDEDGLLGMDLLRLGLERGASAEESAAVIVDLARRFGQGGRAGYSNPSFRYHSSFLVADRREAWVVETAGREAATERISRGARAISNALTLPSLAGAGRALHARIACARTRRTRLESLAAKLGSPLEAMMALSDHGTEEGPDYHWLNGAMSAPCVHAGGLLAASQTTASWLSVLDASGDRHWATATAAPCISLFRPLSLSRRHDCGRPCGAPDRFSLWWRFEGLHRSLLRSMPALPEGFAASRLRTQRQMLDCDEQSAWLLADAWLSRWAQDLAGISAPADRRPAWLRRFWRGVRREAAAGTRLSWREA